MERYEFSQLGAKDVSRLIFLSETERRYHMDMLDRLPVAIAVITPGLRLAAVNRKFRAEFGLRADDTFRLLEEATEPEALQQLFEEVLASPSSEPHSRHVLIGAKLYRFWLQPQEAWEHREDREVLFTAELLGEDIGDDDENQLEAEFESEEEPTAAPAPPSPDNPASEPHGPSRTEDHPPPPIG